MTPQELSLRALFWKQGQLVDAVCIAPQCEFKTVLLILYPKTTDAEYDKIWKDIDKNGDGNLSKEELAGYFGFNYDSLASDMEDERSRVSMSDEQILEALQVALVPSAAHVDSAFSLPPLRPLCRTWRLGSQMHQALHDLEEEAKKKEIEKDKPRSKQGRGSRDSEGIEMIKMPTKITVGIVCPKIEFMQALHAARRDRYTQSASSCRRHMRLGVTVTRSQRVHAGFTCG